MAINASDSLAASGLDHWVMQFPETWQSLVQLFAGQEWLLVSSLVMGLTFAVDLVFRFVLGRFDHRFQRRHQPLLKTLTESLLGPVSVFIWLTGIALTSVTLIHYFDVLTQWVSPIEALRYSLGILIIAWFAFRWLRRMELYLKKLAHSDQRWDKVTIEAAVKVLKLTVFVITGIVVLSALNVDLTGLIAFGGVGGIAVGFAAKDILGNVLGGLMLYMDKPFAPGDWIRSPDRNIEGVVQKIGWRMSVIETFDKRPLYIPNGAFSNIAIENPSRMSHRRIFETIGVRYADVNHVADITESIRKMLQAHPDIDEQETLIVNFNVFNQSTLDIMIYAFTHTREWVKYHAVKEAVLLQVAQIVAQMGAEMAFPTRTLYVEDTVQMAGLGDNDRARLSESQ